MENLEVKLDSVVSEAKVDIALPTFVQTQGLPQDDALAFVKDCAEGKRKIANAVKNKYEGTSGTASDISKYSTFDELSDKIIQIPIEVPIGNAMEQNGGVLPFYDVYNETLKAMKEFAGYGFNGVCAFELDKWSYDDDHKVTLSGADAYYTSDGTFIKDNIIYKNGSQIGELDNSLYQFQDQDKENINRFVVFFSINERYTVSKSLPATSCLNLWCVKGTPLMNFGNSLTSLSSVNVYDGDLVATSENDYKISNTSMLQTLYLPHIKEFVNYTENIFQGFANVKTISLQNLKRVNLKKNLFLSMNMPKIEVSNLEFVNCQINANLVSQCNSTRHISFPNLKETNIDTNDGRCSIVSYCTNLSILSLPKLEKCNGFFPTNMGGNNTIIELGKPVGGNIKMAITEASNTKTYRITIEKGFKSTLNLSYLTALTADCINAIIDNLAVCDGEDKDKYTITLSKSVATTEMESAIVAKGYLFATLG